MLGGIETFKSRDLATSSLKGILHVLFVALCKSSLETSTGRDSGSGHTRAAFGEKPGRGRIFDRVLTRRLSPGRKAAGDLRRRKPSESTSCIANKLIHESSRLKDTHTFVATRTQRLGKTLGVARQELGFSSAREGQDGD